MTRNDSGLWQLNVILKSSARTYASRKSTWWSSQVQQSTHNTQSRKVSQEGAVLHSCISLFYNQQICTIAELGNSVQTQPAHVLRQLFTGRVCSMLVSGYTRDSSHGSAAHTSALGWTCCCTLTGEPGPWASNPAQQSHHHPVQRKE